MVAGNPTATSKLGTELNAVPAWIILNFRTYGKPSAFDPTLGTASNFCIQKFAMKRGRPATGQSPLVSVRLPRGWLAQIDRMPGSRSMAVRHLVGSALIDVQARRMVIGDLPGEDEYELPRPVAQVFVEMWHYSGTLPTGKNIYYGWFIDRELYAVAVYGLSANKNLATFLARATNKPVTATNLLELRRLCRSEPARRDYQLTRFLAKCHKLLRRNHDARFVVSYSDPAHGHDGKIYKAANFMHLGATAAEIQSLDAQGQLVHRRHGRTARRVTTRPKDRWFLDLGPPRRR